MEKRGEGKGGGVKGVLEFLVLGDIGQCKKVVMPDGSRARWCSCQMVFVPDGFRAKWQSLMMEAQ